MSEEEQEKKLKDIMELVSLRIRKRLHQTLTLSKRNLDIIMFDIDHHIFEQAVSDIVNIFTYIVPTSGIHKVTAQISDGNTTTISTTVCPIELTDD